MSDQTTDIAINEAGLFAPKTIEDAYRVAKAYSMSGMLPARFKTPESVMTAMQLAQEMGLKPLTALRQIAVVNGTPSIFGDLPLALCQASGKVESLDEYLVDKDSKKICAANSNLAAEAWGAVIIIKRKGDEQPIERFFTMADAKKAGLGNSPTWTAYPKRMLMYRARSQALKDKFADCLNGVSIAEYDFNVLPDEASDVITTAVEVDKKTESVREKLRAKVAEPIVVAEEPGEFEEFK